MLRLIVILIVAMLVSPALAQTGQTSPVATSVAVTNAAGGTQLIGANGGRHGLIFFNQSGVVISVAPGTAAPTASGGTTVNIAANGGMLTMTCDNFLPCGSAWQAIAASGASNTMTVWEY